MPSLDQAHQHRLYEQFLFERKYYFPERYGRSVLASKVRSLLHCLKKQGSIFFELDYTRGLPSSYDYPYPARMPAFLAQLGLFELERWEEEKKKRQEILKEYLQIADSNRLREFIAAGYYDPRNEIVPLRFAFSHPQAAQMNKSFGALFGCWSILVSIACYLLSPRAGKSGVYSRKLS